MVMVQLQSKQSAAHWLTDRRQKIQAKYAHFKPKNFFQVASKNDQRKSVVLCLYCSFTSIVCVTSHCAVLAFVIFLQDWLRQTTALFSALYFKKCLSAQEYAIFRRWGFHFQKGVFA
jgi:hypothetical protein